MKRRLGIVGGGQLGRMLTISAKQLGFDVTIIDPTPNSPAGQVADRQITAAYDDDAAIRQLAKQVDYMSFEIESAGAKTLEELAVGGAVINPAPQTLAMIKDKLEQKRWLRQAGVPVAEFAEVKTAAEMATVGQAAGYPIVLKARLGAYDGRGNAVVESAKGIAAAWQRLAGRELYVEHYVPFTTELAVIVARDLAGHTAIYPVVETLHRHNICHVVYAPARVAAEVTQRAEKLAGQVAKHLSGAGVFAIEMFVTAKGEVLVNEIAPRVHNSGHLTIEANLTSQFEQQVRAVTGLPLGATEAKVPAAVMVNILGERSGSVKLEGLAQALAIPGVSVHIYGKAETRPERKMGHVTAVADTIQRAEANAIQARKELSI
ncbi:MAG TPA: 5-(carboxyamino)imidazole ribonucleotide synthase [Candidatus Saccharimonadales bacterium]|nr:5-(carboxyamino)imidazole ribonucleotide synthase [Candidatus Saccharimonadales bacterium]